MIQSLRRAHWRVMLTLSVLLPVIIVAGLIVRPEFWKMTPLPEEGGVLSRSMFRRWDEVGLYIRFEHPRKPTERAIMGVLPIEARDEPDVLLYWNPSTNQTGNPGDGSIFLGSLKSRQTRWMNVPLEVPESTGSLILYDLVARKTIARAPWQITFAESTNR